MHDGPDLKAHVLVAALLAAALSAGGAHAQSPAGASPAAQAAAPTPIPTLPPLPPLGGPVETVVPTAGPQPTAPPPAPSAAGATAPPTSAAAPAPPPPGGLPPSVLLLLGIGVLVLVATLVVVLTVLLKKPVVINVPSRSSAPPPPPPPLPEGPAPAGWTEGNVVRAGQPPAGVLDVLPGRFLVDEGNRQTELKIFRTSPGERVETTIGRDAGPPYRHIQLLPESVAGKHAKLVYDRKSYSLINYARTNPTRVYGEEMEENASRRLVHGDRIEIGEVTMTYQED